MTKADILLVTNNEYYIKVIKEALEGQNHRIIRIFNNREELLKYLEEHYFSRNFNTIIVSMFLPKSPRNRALIRVNEIVDKMRDYCGRFSGVKIITLGSSPNMQCCGDAHLSPSRAHISLVPTLKSLLN